MLQPGPWGAAGWIIEGEWAWEANMGQEKAVTNLWGDDFDEFIQEAELANFIVKPPPTVLHAGLQHLCRAGTAITGAPTPYPGPATLSWTRQG